LAVGDAVVVLSTQTANYSNYQPAVGVEIIILCGSNANTSALILYDGVNQSSWCEINNAGNSNNIKFCINNTNYLRYYNEAAFACFSGIQIK